MTWEQVSQVRNAGVRVGSHTCRHRYLPLLADDEAREELRQSLARLREKLGEDVFPFAYPDGMHEAT